MYRYSTEPLNVFLRFDPREKDVLWLTFKQEASDVEITRTKEDLAQTFESMEEKDGWYRFEVSFSQEESASFSANEAVLVQVRWRDKDGKSSMTDVYSFSVNDVLKEGVI